MLALFLFSPGRELLCVLWLLLQYVPGLGGRHMSSRAGGVSGAGLSLVMDGWMDGWDGLR